MPIRKIDFKQALKDPRSVYETPEQVLADPRLDRQGKRSILETWKQRVDGVCTGKESAATAEPNLVRRVDHALRTLEDRRDGRRRRLPARRPLAGRNPIRRD
jgi:hypothetical protein